jgi:hypothetical protein
MTTPRSDQYLWRCECGRNLSHWAMVKSNRMMAFSLVCSTCMCSHLVPFTRLANANQPVPGAPHRVIDWQQDFEVHYVPRQDTSVPEVHPPRRATAVAGVIAAARLALQKLWRRDAHPAGI